MPVAFYCLHRAPCTLWLGAPCVTEGIDSCPLRGSPSEGEPLRKNGRPCQKKKTVFQRLVCRMIPHPEPVLQCCFLLQSDESGIVTQFELNSAPTMYPPLSRWISFTFGCRANEAALPPPKRCHMAIVWVIVLLIVVSCSYLLHSFFFGSLFI